MTYKEVYTMLSGAGVPVAYNAFPTDNPKAPPYICYLWTGSNDFAADDTNYQAIRPVQIELYTNDKDFELEAAVEAVLKANSLPFTRDETYLDSERMYMIVFRTEIVITE